jgi:hypothetical protein
MWMVRPWTSRSSWTSPPPTISSSAPVRSTRTTACSTRDWRALTTGANHGSGCHRTSSWFQVGSVTSTATMPSALATTTTPGSVVAISSTSAPTTSVTSLGAPASSA